VDGAGRLYFAGGRTALNGVKSDNERANARVGATLALPIDRHNSLKLSASTGVSTRTGSDFNAVGVACQYRWGGGILTGWGGQRRVLSLAPLGYCTLGQ
jgi:hypothetical protein